MDEDPADGVPPHAREWQRRADCVLVDIPPGIIQRATRNVALKARKSGTSGTIPQISKICAVFEMYGLSRRSTQIFQKYFAIEEKDFEKQILAWSDYRLTLRTETDLSDHTGPNPFEDSRSDIIP